MMFNGIGNTMLRSREAWIWIAGLTGLVVLAPSLDNHVTICIPSTLGIDFCPGCGLGASISHLVRGEFAESWASHPLAVPTLAILIGRIIHLFRQERDNTTKENYNG
jgi:hypothetical protein